MTRNKARRNQMETEELNTNRRQTRKRKNSVSDDGNNNTIVRRKKKPTVPARKRTIRTTRAKQIQGLFALIIK